MTTVTFPFPLIPVGRARASQVCRMPASTAPFAFHNFHSELFPQATELHRQANVTVYIKLVNYDKYSQVFPKETVHRRMYRQAEYCYFGRGRGFRQQRKGFEFMLALNSCLLSAPTSCYYSPRGMENRRSCWYRWSRAPPGSHNDISFAVHHGNVPTRNTLRPKCIHSSTNTTTFRFPIDFIHLTFLISALSGIHLITSNF